MVTQAQHLGSTTPGQRFKHAAQFQIYF